MVDAKNYKNNVTISGTVLLSTIKTMDTLGPIGQEVLNSHGIKEIVESEQYPYELRSVIHKAVLDKYGEVALIAIGFNNAELLHDLMGGPTIEYSKKNSEGLLSSDIDKNEKSLHEVLEFFFDKGDTVIKQFTSGVRVVEYGNTWEKLDKFVYRLKCTMALEAHSEPFIRGVQNAQLFQSLGKYFRWNREFETDKTESGYGYSSWFWTLRFTPEKSQLSGLEILNEKKNEINSKLMQVVLADAFNQNKKMERLSSQLAKYIPPQINEALFKGDYNTEITTRRKKLTIFFSDIKNFTSTSEGLQPEDLTKYLNEYFSEMTTIALECGATIDKYIGDAMMVFFGDPESEGEREDARACVEMALKMQERMTQLQEKWGNEGFSDPFQVRIGVNTGYCNVGNFGSEQRLTYTIIGGEVNVAQRLESNADANGILMSYETYAHVQDMVEVEEREALKMKGIQRDIKSFAILSRKNINISVDETKLYVEEKQFERSKKHDDSLENRLAKVEKKVDLILNKLDHVD